MQPRPEIAVVGQNLLMNIGLKTVLEKIIPVAEVSTFTDFESFAATGPERFFHFFVASQTFVAHASFFRELRHKTIVLVDRRARTACTGMHTLDVQSGEERFIHDLLQMHNGAHPHSHTPPPPTDVSPLTDREVEVLTLVARGYLNKQIAEALHIGLTTVITHRRNIMEKLGMHSVAELTLYAVTAGYVDLE